MTHGDRICIVTNMGLAIEASAMFVGLAVYYLYATLSGHIKMEIIIILWSLYFLCLGVILVTCHRWLAWLIFDAEGISYHAILRKSEFKPYSAYAHIFAASYNNFTTRHRDIVFSTKMLTSRQLENINEIGMDMNTIKISCTKRNYQRLHVILPPAYQRKLEMAIAYEERPRTKRRRQKRNKR